MRVFTCIGLLCAGLSSTQISIAQSTPPRAAAYNGVVKGSEEISLRWPVDVASASPDTIAVVDAYGPRLIAFKLLNRSWSVAAVVDLPAAPVGVDWDGRRFVTTLRQPGGLVAIEPPDFALTALDLPDEVVPGPVAATSGGVLLVLDLATSSVLRVSSNGEVLASTKVSGTATGLESLPSGGFMLALGDQGRIERVNSDGVVTASIDLPREGPVPAWPTGMAASVNGQLLVADRHNGRLLVYDPQGKWIGIVGRKGWDPGLFRYPTGLALLDEDLILVADQGNGRVQIFQLNSVNSAR